MSAQTWWYAARATGYVAWALVTWSVLLGLVLGTRLTGRRPAPAWVLDVHRFLGATAVVFTLMHVAGLVADNYVHFGPAEVVLPFASKWRRAPVALGVVATYLLLAVEVSSLLLRRLPRRVWRGIHATSYVVFWSSTFHLVLAGTDTANAVSRVGATVAMAAVVFLTLVRVLDGRAARRPRPASPRLGARAAAPRPFSGVC